MAGTRSISEENYLKTIYSLNQRTEKGATTTAIARQLDTKAASVTEMMRKLSEKGLVNYEKYKRIRLSDAGRKVAIGIIRKHRLWEVFLVNKLKFGWDEVHDIAEELEHIQSDLLTDRIDEFLDYPEFDPHGDPIPDKNGNILPRKEVLLHDLKAGETGLAVGVKDSSNQFLKHLDLQNIKLGTQIEILECFDYDDSRAVKVDSESRITLSGLTSKNLLIRKI